MKNVRDFVVLVGIVVFVAGVGKAQDIVDMVKRVKPAVVTVLAKNAFGIEEGQGSGFFIARNQIITCFHVIDGASAISIRLNDSTLIKAKHIIAQDSLADVAILELESNAPARITPLVLQNKLPEQGERIYVVGNPLGLEQSVSDGIVSSVRVQKKEGKVIQFTAAISSGNSGSPLLDGKGNVYGVAKTVLEGGQNLNFACPSERIPKVNLATPIAFLPTTKKYDGVEMNVTDAFTVDTTLRGIPPAGLSLKEQNIWRLRTAALRVQWESEIVDKNLTRLTRAVKRNFSDLDISTDTLLMRQAHAVVIEGLGDNYGLSSLSPEDQGVIAGIRQGLMYMGAAMAMKASITPIESMTGMLEERGQIWVELEKDANYAVITLSDTSKIKDVDLAVFYQDSTEKWIPLASDTRDSAHPYTGFEAPHTGEYAIVWRVAKRAEGIKQGGVGAIIFAE